MKFGITQRLFLSILGAAALSILTLFLVMQWNLDRGFHQYLKETDQSRMGELIDDLGRRYEEQGNWDFLRNDPSPGKPPPPAFDPHKPRGGPLVVLNEDRKTVFGFQPPDEKIDFRPITVRDRTVGYAGMLSPKHFLHPMQSQFLREQRLALAAAAAGLVLIVAILSIPLARRLVRPIKALAAATRDIASGHYATRIAVRSSDELGRLAGDFNEMSRILEKNEKARREWIADISHELRTPVAILRGEIEALLDGIRKITPERISSLHGETIRLHRLVEDLYQLSLSDLGALTYRKEQLDPADLLRKVAETYRPAFEGKGIHLGTHLTGGRDSLVFADRERLDQLFANLAENSLRFTDPGGELGINLSTGNDRIMIEFQDSPPGVPEEELGRLFDRLYRLEGSRNRASGGAGLGLAICKTIVEAHAGTISAHASPMGGLLIRISLPAEGSPS